MLRGSPLERRFRQRPQHCEWQRVGGEGVGQETHPPAAPHPRQGKLLRQGIAGVVFPGDRQREQIALGAARGRLTSTSVKIRSTPRPDIGSATEILIPPICASLDANQRRRAR